jgi:putative membrane protein
VQYIYILLIVILTAVFLLFAFQNLESVTVSFYSVSFTLPLSLLVLLVYVIGMLTGGFASSLLGTLFRGASRKPEQD